MMLEETNQEIQDPGSGPAMDMRPLPGVMLESEEAAPDSGSGSVPPKDMGRPMEAVAYNEEEAAVPPVPPVSASFAAVADSSVLPMPHVEPMSVVGPGNDRRADMAISGGFGVAQSGPDDRYPTQSARTTGGLQPGWSSDLFDCFQDEETCWWSFWCPCLIFSRTAQGFGIAKSSVTCGMFGCLLFLVIFAFMVQTKITFIMAFILIGVIIITRTVFRGRIREQLSIEGSMVQDCCIHTCCSCCAISQEARQSKFQRHPYIDFCTGERIALSSEIDNPTDTAARLTFQEELNSLSKFSKLVLGLSAGIFLIACLVCNYQSIFVLILVFVQPFLYVYLVWWRAHREDAVLDIIIKLFAIGFWWTTPVAMIFELLLQVIMTLIFIFGLSFEEIMVVEGQGDSVDSEENKNSVKSNLGMMILLAFCFSFIVAAGVEETMKHLIVRCCQYTHAPRNQYTILVYMMAGALGFATAENIGYVFGYSAKNPFPGASRFATELIVLGLRVLMPVHVICAGIQAINTSKRDLEARNLRLWHILLPAIAFHGAFDFVTMVFGVLQYAYSIETIFYDLVSLLVAFFVAVCGAIYLYLSYKKQEDRIMIGWQRLEDDGTETA